MPVHHDRDYAALQGSPNIFLNILSDTGFCTRFLTDWAGPEAMVRKIAIRLGVPAYAGSKLEYTGSVTGLSEQDRPRPLMRWLRPRTIGEGTPGGIGLEIVRSVIEHHGGELAIDSVPGAGTSVTLSFPRAGAPVRRARAAPRAGAEGHPGDPGAGARGARRSPRASRPAPARA